MGRKYGVRAPFSLEEPYQRSYGSLLDTTYAAGLALAQPSPRASMIPGKWWTSHNIPIDHTTAKLEDFTDEHNTDVLPSSAFSLDLVQLDASL